MPDTEQKQSNGSVICLEIEATDKMESSLHTDHYQGFGDNGSACYVRGEIKKITFVKNGHSQFSLWIDEDGKLTLTDYAGLCFQQQMPQNLTLTPHRKWRER